MKDREYEGGRVKPVIDRGKNSKAHIKKREWNKNSVSGRKRRLLENQGCFCAFGHKDSVPLLWRAAVQCLLEAPSLLLSLLISFFLCLIFFLSVLSHISPSLSVSLTLAVCSPLPTSLCLILFLAL